jgi:hypothetical protein
VFGQANFRSGLANRGANVPKADILNWCYGGAIADGRLIVGDTGNRSVLVRRISRKPMALPPIWC